MTKQLPHFSEELQLWKKGIPYVIGLDEVGKGAFAGPATVSGVVYHPSIVNHLQNLTLINDSKKLSPLQRKKAYPLITHFAHAHAIASSSVALINQKGITYALHQAFHAVVLRISHLLNSSALYILIDGTQSIPTLPFPQKTIIRGDQLSLSVASASILAKVDRDSQMDTFATHYPEYGFEKNKGYGSLFHRTQIARFGLSPLHRTSYNLSKWTEKNSLLQNKNL